MANYFEVKITFDKTLENGKEKKVSELYLVDAVSFTEAETKITAEFAPLPNFKVKSIRQYKVAEIVNKTNLDDSRYFKCKLNFITLDEKSGAEKKTAVYMLVDAETLDKAKVLLVEHMKSTMADYSIEKIEETKIMAVI
jgi:uncharacterized protein YrzB (UPF0473 family)